MVSHPSVSVEPRIQRPSFARVALELSIFERRILSMAWDVVLTRCYRYRYWCGNLFPTGTQSQTQATRPRSTTRHEALWIYWSSPTYETARNIIIQPCTLTNSPPAPPLLPPPFPTLPMHLHLLSEPHSPPRVAYTLVPGLCSSLPPPPLPPSPPPAFAPESIKSRSSLSDL
jgi:hypothetical protein